MRENDDVYFYPDPRKHSKTRVKSLCYKTEFTLRNIEEVLEEFKTSSGNLPEITYVKDDPGGIIKEYDVLYQEDPYDPETIKLYFGSESTREEFSHTRSEELFCTHAISEDCVQKERVEDAISRGADLSVASVSFSKQDVETLWICNRCGTADQYAILDKL